MSLISRLEQLSDNLNLFDNDMDKYEYIIELGKIIPPLDKSYKKEEYRIKGCQSTVWMFLDIVDKKLMIQADADALIVRGMVALIIEIFSTASCEEITSFDKELLKSLGLDEIITPGRQNGVASMLDAITEFCYKRSDHG